MVGVADARKHRSYVWGALLFQPLMLFVVFGLFAVRIDAGRKLPRDELRRAIEAIAVWPIAIGFALGLALTLRLARREGLSLSALGWRQPRFFDVTLGLGVGGLLWFLNARVFHPLLRAVLPTFDPTLPAQSVQALLLAFAISIAGEETLYRGYGFVALQTRYGAPSAVAVTSVFYALLTPAGWPLMLWALGFGVLLGLLRWWRDSLWPGAIAHVLVSLGPALTR